MRWTGDTKNYPWLCLALKILVVLSTPRWGQCVLSLRRYVQEISFSVPEWILKWWIHVSVFTRYTYLFWNNDIITSPLRNLHMLHSASYIFAFIIQQILALLWLLLLLYYHEHRDTGMCTFSWYLLLCLHHISCLHTPSVLFTVFGLSIPSTNGLGILIYSVFSGAVCTHVMWHLNLEAVDVKTQHAVKWDLNAHDDQERQLQKDDCRIISMVKKNPF